MLDPGDEVIIPEPSFVVFLNYLCNFFKIFPFHNCTRWVVREHNIFILSDEIYCELTYGNKNHVSIAEIDGMYERTIVVNGFSKSYAMTGWRLGYALGPVPVIAQMTKLHQYGIMSAPTTAQYAAIEALRNGDRDVEMMRGEYDMRRRLVQNSSLVRPVFLIHGNT